MVWVVLNIHRNIVCACAGHKLCLLLPLTNNARGRHWITPLKEITRRKTPQILLQMPRTNRTLCTCTFTHVYSKLLPFTHIIENVTIVGHLQKKKEKREAGVRKSGSTSARGARVTWQVDQKDCNPHQSCWNTWAIGRLSSLPPHLHCAEKMRTGRYLWELTHQAGGGGCFNEFWRIMETIEKQGPPDIAIPHQCTVHVLQVITTVAPLLPSGHEHLAVLTLSLPRSNNLPTFKREMYSSGN